jgi:hypothetical protein
VAHISVVDWLERTGRRPIVVASFPRSGTHLLIDTLRLDFPDCRSWKWWGERTDRLYLNFASLAWERNRVTERKAIGIMRRSRIPVIKTHAVADFSHDVVDGALLKEPAKALAGWLRQHARTLYIYRDGRNALCSLFEMKRRYDADSNVPFSTFLRQCIGGKSRVREWADHVRGWMDNADVFCIGMEELLAHPAICVKAIADKLGLPSDKCGCKLPRRIRSIADGRIQRLFSLQPESTALIHPEGGRMDWRQFFTAADRRFFAEESDDLLIKLGYEEDENWIDPALDGEVRFPTGFFSPTRSTSNESVVSLA